MEAILVVFTIIFFIIAALSSLFLSGIQPLWAIIDIAVSEKISKGAKITLLILILAGMPLCITTVIGVIFIPFLALITFFYGCFFTRPYVYEKLPGFLLPFVCVP